MLRLGSFCIKSSFPARRDFATFSYNNPGRPSFVKTTEGRQVPGLNDLERSIGRLAPTRFCSLASVIWSPFSVFRLSEGIIPDFLQKSSSFFNISQTIFACSVNIKWRWAYKRCFFKNFLATESTEIFY